MAKKADAGKERAWTQRMAQWERSGISRRAWCAANGVTISTFDYWRRRLRARRSTKASPRQRFVPVVVKSASIPTGSAATIEIALSRGIALRAPATVEVRWLGALVREIEAC
jgi:hypothetical protein